MMTTTQQTTDPRTSLTGCRRIVVKIGSRVLVQRTGRPDMRRIRGLVNELAGLRKSGQDVVFVTSGAIGAGLEALGMKRRPTLLADLQMAAAVGQSRLMTRYDKLFASRRQLIGQVLLTHDDLKHRERHLNARNTMMTMMNAGVIPIVNENDVVAVDEIKFGDNDLLASLVVHLIEANLLILLSTTDGLKSFSASGRGRRIPLVTAVTDEILALANGKGSPLSTGGMASKLKSAHAATQSGAQVVIADGRMPGIIGRILKGEDVGTLILPSAKDEKEALSGRKRWIAFFHKPKGTLKVDAGAARALLKGGKSLLPIGVTTVEGEFDVGAAVDILGPDGALIARGLVCYSSQDIVKIKGQRTEAIPGILNRDEGYDEVIHRDNLATLVGGE